MIILMFCSKWSNNNGVTRPYMGKNKRQTSKNEDWVRGINENSSYGVPGFLKTMSQALKVWMNLKVTIEIRLYLQVDAMILLVYCKI